MAKIETHCNDCKKVLGKPYLKVHEWLDYYAKEYNPLIYLEKHRMFRHHAIGVEKAEKIFGYYGGLAAKLHIIRDCEFYVYVNWDTIREDDIQDLFEKALIFCHDPLDEEY